MRWEIFQPNWEYLNEIDAFSLASLVGMSVGLHPYFSNPQWVDDAAIPYFNGTARDLYLDNPVSESDAEKKDKLWLFIGRITIAVANLSPRGELLAVTGVVEGENTLVKAADFVAFAIRKNSAQLAW